MPWNSAFSLLVGQVQTPHVNLPDGSARIPEFGELPDNKRFKS